MIAPPSIALLRLRCERRGTFQTGRINDAALKESPVLRCSKWSIDEYMHRMTRITTHESKSRARCSPARRLLYSPEHEGGIQKMEVVGKEIPAELEALHNEIVELRPDALIKFVKGMPSGSR